MGGRNGRPEEAKGRGDSRTKNATELEMRTRCVRDMALRKRKEKKGDTKAVT